MISKGNQRAGGQQLATHLLNQIDNERVQVLEIRGSIANDLHGAMAEWRATSTGTKCKKYLYSLSINPDPKQRPLNREEFLDFIARTEKSLGLEDQPRAVVFHVKAGREHCHVAWSRIDTEKLKAVQLSHDRQKLRTVAQDFARDHGLELPQGMKKNREKSRYQTKEKHKNLAELQQQERTGIDKEQRQREITEAWTQTATGKAFSQALEECGYYLAQGTKRAYVLVDRYGEAHSLSRQIAEAKAKDIKARLQDRPLESLPTVAQAQKQAKERIKGDLQEFFFIKNDTLSLKLAAQQEKKRGALAKKKAALLERQKLQRQKLQDRIRERNQTAKQSKNKGLISFLAKAVGLGSSKEPHKRIGVTPAQKKSIEAQQRRHNRQLRNITRQERSLRALQKREARTLKAKILREARQKVRERAKNAPEKERLQTLKRFRNNAKDIAAKSKTIESAARDTETLKPDKSLPFSEAAAPEKSKKEFSEKFARALKARAAQKKEGRKKDRGRGPTPS